VDALVVAALHLMMDCNTPCSPGYFAVESTEKQEDGIHHRHSAGVLLKMKNFE